jgi:hypothetical protein
MSRVSPHHSPTRKVLEGVRPIRRVAGRSFTNAFQNVRTYGRNSNRPPYEHHPKRRKSRPRLRRRRLRPSKDRILTAASPPRNLAPQHCCDSLPGSSGHTAGPSGERAANPIPFFAPIISRFYPVLLLCGGFYILQDSFANPLTQGAAAVLCAALMITFTAILLFFLIKPGKRLRTTSFEHRSGAATASLRPAFKPAPGGPRAKIIRATICRSNAFTSITIASGRNCACRFKRAESPESSALPE